MSDSTNPIFDSEREFLERQKEEYKNALLGNVEELKDTSQRVGKIVLIAGGVLAGAYFITKMIRSNRGSDDNAYYLSERKAQRIRKGQPNQGYDYVGSYEDEENENHQNTDARDTSLAKNFAQSDMFKMISSQVSALLLVLLTRKLEEYMGVNASKKEVEPEAETSVVIIEEATMADPDTTYSDKDVR
jgi:flagellar biogenesis protein FliO